MNLTVGTHALSEALSAVGPAVAARTTRPVLANVRLEADAAGGITADATDMEVHVRYRVAGAAVKEPGAVLVPPDRLLKILKESGGETVTLIGDGTTETVVRVPHGTFRIPACTDDTFPAMPDADDGVSLTLAAGELRRVVGLVQHAVEKKESTRWAITGALVEYAAGVVRLVGTDTRRLAVAEGTAEAPDPAAGKRPACILPLKAVAQLDRLLHDDAEAVRVTLAANWAAFRGERATLHTKLVEGRYPPFTEIVPKKAAHKVPLNVAAFAAAVRQAAIMADGDSKRVDLSFDVGTLFLKARTADKGNCEVDMPLPGYAGGGCGIAFDPSYLLDICRAADGYETLTLEMTDGAKPAVFRADERTMWLVMPMVG